MICRRTGGVPEILPDRKPVTLVLSESTVELSLNLRKGEEMLRGGVLRELVYDGENDLYMGMSTRHLLIREREVAEAVR